MTELMTYAQQRELPRVVLADDDDFVCSMIATQLEHKFRCVGTAGDGTEAIAVVGKHRPDVVVLDVVMPGVGALEATRAIRVCSPETAIVFLSSDEMRSEVLDLVNAGASAY